MQHHLQLHLHAKPNKRFVSISTAEVSQGQASLHAASPTLEPNLCLPPDIDNSTTPTGTTFFRQVLRQINSYLHLIGYPVYSLLEQDWHEQG